MPSFAPARRFARWLFRTPLATRPTNSPVRRTRLGMEQLEVREVPALTTLAYVNSGPAAGVFSRAFVAEGRIGNNALNGTHEVDVSKNTSGPFVAGEYANGVWTKSATPFSFTYDAGTGVATFTSGSKTVTSSSLSFTGLVGDDTMTLRTVAGIAGSSSTLTNLRLSVGGGAFADVPNPDGSAGPASTGSAHAGSPDQDVLQIVGATLRDGFTLTGDSVWNWSTLPTNSSLAFQIAAGTWTPPTVSVTGAVDAAEGGATGSFTLIRTGGDPNLPLTAYFTLAGTATKGASATDPLGDYTVSGATYNASQTRYQVVFPGKSGATPGQTTVTVPIAAIDDDVFDPDETVSLTLAGSQAVYTLGTPAERTLTILDNETALAPLGLARGGNVRPRDGAVGVEATDLTSSGFGAPWGQRRVWTNDPMKFGYAGNQWGGNGWVLLDLPSLVKAGDSVFQVQVGTDFLTFDKSAGSETYTPRFFTLDTLTHDTAAKTFTLTRTDGTRVTFLDFDESRPAAARGQFEKQTEPDGLATLVGSRTEAGQPLSVGRAGLLGSQAAAELHAFTWTGDRIASVTLSRIVSGQPSLVVRSVEYTYYADGDAHGNAGDLKTAIVKDANGAIVDRSYYRYYTADGSGGYQGGLKMSFGPAAFERLLYATGDPFGVSDTVAGAYADLAFTYDATKRVASRTVAGAGASDTGGRGTFSYAYAKGTAANDVNAWKVRTTVARPDATQEIVYSNAYAEPMLQAVTPAGNTQQWVTYTRYDSAGRAVLTANPSAVTGYSESKADLVHFVNGNAEYLLDSGGLITVTSYSAATNPFVGSVAGYYAGTSLRRGEFGTLVPQNATTYATHTDSGITVHPVASTTVYRNDNGTGAQTTAFAYEWFPGTVQARVINTTPPVIGTNENGSGVTVGSSTVFDSYGRAEWSRDTAGVVTRTTRDLATGAVTRVVEDVSYSDPAMPVAFATYKVFLDDEAPGAFAATGKNRATQYEVDSLGRTTRIRDANVHDTYIVYHDPSHEVRTYRGWTGTATTGPVEVVREDRSRGYVETYTSSATPDVDGSTFRPLGTEAPVLESLTRTAVNAAGQSVSTDAYFDLAGLAYSPGAMGVAGTHFYRTAYGYDAAGRSDRTTSPGLTTDTTVYDGLGRTVSTWTESAAAGLAKTQVSAFQYDNGTVGDSNRTAATRYPGGGAEPRVTQAWFDWRNRPVAEKQGAQSSETTAGNRPLTYTVFNNLGEPVSTAIYDGDGVIPVDANADGTPDTPAAALLRGRTLSAFNTWGQVFQTTDLGANPLTGALTLDPLVTDTWFDLRGLAIKTRLPGGWVEKLAHDGLGQVTVRSTSDGGNDDLDDDEIDEWAEALSVDGDTVLSQTLFGYDAVGQVIATVNKTRFDGETGTGALGDFTNGVKARITFDYAYFDAADRLTDTVSLGTGDKVFSPSNLDPGPTPDRNDEGQIVTSYGYDGGGRVQLVTDPLDRVFLTEYDALGRPVTETLAANTDDAWTTSYGYDSGGRLGSTTQPGSRVTTYGYDGFERQNAVTLPMGRTFTTASNALGQTVSDTDAEGSVTRTLYDTLGRAISVTAAFGSSAAGTVQAVHDVFGRVIQSTDERGKVTSTLFNDAERKTTVTDAVGKGWTSYADLAGNVTKSVNPLGQAWESVFDIWNRFTSSKDPLGNTTQQKHLVDGEKFVTIDARNNPSAVVLDRFGRSGQTLDAADKGSEMVYDAAHRVKTVTDATGAVTEYQYDNLDRVRVLYEAKDAPEERKTEYHYDNRGDRVSVFNPRGYETFSEFDDAGRVIQRTTAIGTDESLVTDFAYDKMNRVTLVTAPGDRQTLTNYDKQGRVTDVTTGYGTPLARTKFHLYDAAGNLEYLVEPLGRITEFEYDNLDRVTKVTRGYSSPDARSTSTQFDDAGRVASETDARGFVTKYGYDDANRRTSMTDPYGKVTTYGYNKAGQQDLVIDPLGHATVSIYDSRNRVTGVFDPLLNFTEFEYDDLGRRTKVIDANGHETVSKYNLLGQLVSVTNGEGEETTFGYDPNGNRVSVRNMRGAETAYEYDAVDHLVKVINPETETTEYEYDPESGDKTAMIDGTGKFWIYGYDVLGRQNYVRSPRGSETTTVFDAADRKVSVTDPAGTTKYDHNQVDLLVSVTDPRTFVTQYQYDKAGNRTLVWDASGNKTSFDHDKLNRLKTETDPLGKNTVYDYDDAGRLVTITDRLNRIRGFGYDDANRKTSETWYIGPTITQTQTFGYDDVGNLISTTDPDGNTTLTYDAANRVQTQSGPYGVERTFFYEDEAGNRTRVTDNKGGEEVSTYDLANRLETRSLTVGGTTTQVAYTYTDRGELETETRTGGASGTVAAGSTKYAYNDDGQVRLVTHKNAIDVAVANYTYLYDLAGRLTEKTENGVVTNYDYDAAGQLLQDGNNTFTYDKTGNRTMPGYGSSTGNRITTDGTWTFGYDDAGRVTSRSQSGMGELWSYVYDHRGALVAATKQNGVGVVLGVVTNRYDAWGNLIRRTETGLNGVAVSDERFAVDGWDTAKPTPMGTENFDPWADVDASGNVLTRRIFGAGFDDPVARVTGGVVSWYGTDRQGSVRQVFDNSGGVIASNDFDAWGNVTAGALTDRYGFTGLDFDALTKLWMPASGRPYDSGSGRWLAGDEKGFDTGDVNLTRYVGNGPTNGVDPSGYADPKKLKAWLDLIQQPVDPEEQALIEQLEAKKRELAGKPISCLGRSTEHPEIDRLKSALEMRRLMASRNQILSQSEPTPQQKAQAAEAKAIEALPSQFDAAYNGQAKSGNILAIKDRQYSIWEGQESTAVFDAPNGKRYRLNVQREDNPGYALFMEGAEQEFSQMVRDEIARRQDARRADYKRSVFNELDITFGRLLPDSEYKAMRAEFSKHIMQFAPPERMWVLSKPVGGWFPQDMSVKGVLAFDETQLSTEQIAASIALQKKIVLWGSAMNLAEGLEEWNADRRSMGRVAFDFGFDVLDDTNTVLMVGGAAKVGGKFALRSALSRGSTNPSYLYSQFGKHVGSTSRTLPTDVGSKITLVGSGDPLPVGLKVIEEAATHPRTGEIFINRAFWNRLSDTEKARVYYEELSHQSRILATPKFLRPYREGAMIVSNTFRFVEEFRAASYATESYKKGFIYAWNYKGIEKGIIPLEIVLVGGVPVVAGSAIRNELKK